MSKKKKKSHAPALLGALCAILFVLIAGYFAVLRPLKQRAVNKVAEKAISHVAEEAGVESSEAEALYSNMTEEDKAVVQDIIEEHADAETMQKAVDLYQDGDMEGLKEMASSELSEEEIQQMKELYQKYVAE